MMLKVQFKENNKPASEFYSIDLPFPSSESTLCNNNNIKQRVEGLYLTFQPTLFSIYHLRGLADYRQELLTQTCLFGGD